MVMVNKVYLDKSCGRTLVEKLSGQDLCLSILIEVISKINPRGLDPAQFKGVRIDLNELKEFMGRSDNNTISLFKRSIKKIMETVIEFEDDKHWRATSFFQKAAIIKTTNEIYVDISTEFIPCLTNLKDFLVLSRNAIKANLRSIRFYTFLRAIHKDAPKNITIDEVQSVMDTNYGSYGSFKQKFLIPVINDLQKAGINLHFKEKTGARNRVIGLDFYFSEPEDIQDKLISIEKKKGKANIERTAGGRTAYAEPRPNYKPAVLPDYSMTDEEVEAAKIAKATYKPGFIKDKGG